MIGAGLLWDGVRTRRREHPMRPRNGRGWFAAAAIGSVGAAVVHLTVMPEHFDESALYGTFFLCAAIAQFAGAGLLVMRPTPALAWATVTGNAAIIALWLVTRLVAVPIGPGAGTTERFGARDLIASGCELITLLACASWLARRRRRIDVGGVDIAHPRLLPVGQQ